MSVNCSICCENVDFSNEEISVLNCGHLFHHTCLQQWLDTSSTCPDCRATVGQEGFVKKIYPKVNVADEISYDWVSNETKSLFNEYEEQTKSLQKRFLEKFAALERDLQVEKINHGETLKKLEEERNSNLSLVSQIEALQIINDDVKAVSKNNHYLNNELKPSTSKFY